jgi:hypothetical protein
MNNTDQLRQLMTLDADINTPEIELRFEQIAKMLFESFAIQKGEKKYLFKEIEFYFYNKNHRDMIYELYLQIICFFLQKITCPRRIYFPMQKFLSANIIR